MGKTVESYRVSLDKEMQSWSRFARALRKEDRVVYDQLMDVCRNYASAGNHATRSVLFEAMIMCILLDQQKLLNRLKKEIASKTKSSSS